MEELKSLMLDSIEDVLTWIVGEKNILDNSLFAGQITNDQFKQRWEIAEKRALNAIMVIKDNNTRIPPATAGKGVDVGKLAKDALELANLVLEYDKAIQFHANKGKSFVESDVLDELYEKWLTKATAIKEAIEKGEVSV